MRSGRFGGWVVTAFAGVVVLGLAAAVPPAAAGEPEWSFRELDPVPGDAAPSRPVLGDFPIQLVLDDGSAEGAFGVAGAGGAARQFLWFQRFSPPVADLDLEEIRVLFPDDPQISPGSAIQLVVYQDLDGDPANGAVLLLALDETVQVADGASFSIYPLAPAVEIRGGGDVYFGVVNRYVVSGVTPITQPAAIDTGASAMRSWVATWSGDPPHPPHLPPDQSLFLVDDLVAGNWTIRGFGTPAPVVAIPALGLLGLAALALALAGLGAFVLRRRRGGGTPLTVAFVLLLSLGPARAAWAAPPAASDVSVTTDEDFPVAVTLVAIDPEGDPLTYSVGSPANGTLSGVAPDLVYTPDPDFNGADGFTYTASDGTSTSNVATVSITVEAVNDRPVALDHTLTTIHDVPVDLTLPATDVDGDPVTYFPFSSIGGSASASGNVITYTPHPGFGGTGSYRYLALDGQSQDEGEVTVIVEGPPVPEDQLVRAGVDAPVAITLIAPDPNGDPVTFALADPPIHGTLTGTPPDLVYTPDPGFGGADGFTFTATDGTFTSGEGTITLEVATGLLIGDFTAFEGNGGTTDYTFAVTLIGNVPGGFDLPFSTADGTATAPEDYTAAAATLSFDGFDREEHTIAVAVHGDAAREGDETFGVVLGAPAPTVGNLDDGTGLGTIREDEGPKVSSFVYQVRDADDDVIGVGVPITDAAIGGTVRALVTWDRETDFGGCGGPGPIPNEPGCPPFPVTFATPGENASATLAFRLARWLSRVNTLIEYDVLDAGEQIPDVDVHFTGGVGLQERPAFVSVDQVLANRIDVDTRNPAAAAIVAEPAILGEQDAGAGTFQITVTFDEPMDTASTPVLGFPGEDPGATITATGGTWLDATAYRFVFDVADADQVLPAVDVAIDSAADLLGNPQQRFEAEALFAIDGVPPRVAEVDSVASTPDGALTDCETVHGQPLHLLLVSFDEPLRDPPGDGAPGDVTNPASWLLVEAGPDAELATTGCGAPAGDDLAVPLVEVAWDAGSATATLDPGGALADGLYRLFACGTGASVLADLAGNPLDGAGAGTAGDDFVRFFRADPNNLFADGHFDCDLGAWVPVSTNPNEILHSEDDADGSGDSGSAAVDNLTASTDFALGQCLPADSGADYSLSGRVRMATAAPGIGVRLSCEFFGGTGCGGTSLGVPATSTLFLGDTGTTWAEIEDQIASPAGTASVLCSVDLLTPGGASFEARLDRLRLVDGSEVIFEDGLESGDTSAWSQAVGVARRGSE